MMLLAVIVIPVRCLRFAMCAAPMTIQQDIQFRLSVEEKNFIELFNTEDLGALALSFSFSRGRLKLT